MEAALRMSVHGGFVKEEKKTDSSSAEDEGCSDEIVLKVGNRRSREQDDDNQKDLTSRKQGHIMPKMEMSPSELHSTLSSFQKNQEDRLRSAKAEMGEVMEENQRLKMYLDRIMKDYRALQMQFHDIVQQENKPSGSSVTTHQETDQESEFVSLSLGRSSSADVRKDDSSSKNSSKEKVDDEEEDKGGLALGLDCKFELSKSTPQTELSTNPSPETSLDQEVKEDAGETCPSQKGLKTMRSGEDEDSQQNPAKRARVSVRVRCDTPTMNDGCQWRKYGQKIAKGNPCPRAYYRCTVAPNCPVRKQVQRCAEDMSILITTYEGTHNHPLPISATAMASTTSAAACMLMSGSSSSGSGQTQSATVNLSSANINGLNFYLSDNSKAKPFYLPNSSISSSPSFPTITLDLTTNSSASSHLNKLGNIPPRYSTTNLNFSSLESSSLPISWSNGVLNYGNQPYNKNQIGSLSFGRQPQETTLYQSCLQKNILNSTQQSQVPPETLEAATKAITSDPNFQSALAAALSTIIGMGSSSAATLGNQVAAEKSCQNLKLQQSESFPVLSSFPSTSNANKCAPSFLNKAPSSTNSQPGSLMFLPPSSPFSTSNNKSTSPGDNRDHIS